MKYPDRNSIIEFKRTLISVGKKPATVKLYLSAIKRFFAWLESEKLYQNITAGIKAPKTDKGHKKDAFTGEQIKQVMSTFSTSTLEGLRNFAMMGLITTAGLTLKIYE